MVDFQRGEDVLGYYIEQTAFDTLLAPMAGDAFRARTIAIEPNSNRTPVDDDKGHSSYVEQFDGRRSANVSAETLVRPADAGESPQLGQILEHLFGMETVVASTSVTYAFLSDYKDNFGTLYKKNSYGYEYADGVIWNNLALAFGNDSPITAALSGMARDYGHRASAAAGMFTATPVPTVSGGTGTGATIASITVDAQGRITAVTWNVGGTSYATGDVITFTQGSVTATYTLLAADVGGGGTLQNLTGKTITPAAGTALATPNYGNEAKPLYGTAGSLSIDGTTVAVGFREGTFNVQNGASLYEDDAFQQMPTAVIDDAKRMVTADLSFTVVGGSASNMNYITDAKAQTRRNVVVTLGLTSGRMLTINMPRFEFTPAGVQTPAAGRSTFQFSGQAFATKAGNDEATLVFE